MKTNFLIILALIIGINISCNRDRSAWIRINQLGYRPADIKVAVFISKKNKELSKFRIVDARTGIEVFSDEAIKAAPMDPFVSCYRLPFSRLKKPGTYRIVAGKAESPDFVISDTIYVKTADYLLRYMRQQRCGYNPYLQDSCHTHDGYEIYGRGDSAHVDVTGGWHDAADYLQYVATSANAVYQMLFAYSQNKPVFGDEFDASGLPGPDGKPDILNESLWGLEWLLKMNPRDSVMYNQIADDRDHIGFRLPVGDKADYGKGSERPVYLCTGEPQGVFKYKNRATGIASTAGKYASAFARAAIVFSSDAGLADLLRKKAVAAFQYGLDHPGACQTAPGKAPYFYEEDNWTDDMELAASELFLLTGDQKYLEHAVRLGRQEPVTPWIGSDTARHYQWYPFVNMGHPGVAVQEKLLNDGEFTGYMKKGIELTLQKAVKNPFLVGVPFIWCSNNLVASILTQMHLYAGISSDSTYMELEAAHRDWLFGCNPWGTSMIVGLPENGDYPADTHSSYVIRGGQVEGGLVDGPVYSSIFRAHSKYVSMKNEDEYAEFQTKLAMYHDDIGDYTSNECTMDGTASLIYYLSALGSEESGRSGRKFVQGAVTRMDTSKKEIWLCFTAHDFSDGFGYIIPTLKKHGVRASFFLTGDFLRTAKNNKLIKEIVKSGHYVGPHSDKHLLYCDWTKRDSTLVDKKLFTSDLAQNYKALESFGITPGTARVFLPPYEWHNDTIAHWTRQLGLNLVNISSGTRTSQDWTFPGNGGKYYPSSALMKDLTAYESSVGLNGYILLIHPGTDPRRTDKFYLKLDSILTWLEKKDYKFRSFSEF